MISVEKDLQLYEVNLAVANVCNASCLYCPRSFVQAKEKFMPPELVEKIMREVGSWQFQAHHPVVHSVLSENGEPFLHPQIIDLLKIVRGTTGGTEQKMAITMFSNFSVLTEDIAEKVISQCLFDSIHVNIDGFTPESYQAVKGLDLSVVSRNLKNFIRIREREKSSIRVLVHVISHYTYTELAKKFFGVAPVKGNGKEFPQDGPVTAEYWKEIINPALDATGEDSVMFWAERYNKAPKQGSFSCPNLGRVRHVAYINPVGDVYACCFDAGNDLVVGNVRESSLLEISASERRKELIRKLEQRKFDEVGFPCTRVDSCQGLSRGEVN